MVVTWRARAGTGPWGSAPPRPPSTRAPSAWKGCRPALLLSTQSPSVGDSAGMPLGGPRRVQRFFVQMWWVARAWAPGWPRHISGEDLVPVSVATALGSGLLGRHTFVPRGGPRTSPELSGMLSCPGRLQGDRRAPSTGRAGRRVARQQACVGVSTWTQPSLRLSRTPSPRRVLQNPNLPPGHSDAVTAEAGCGCLRPRESNLENKVIPL